MSTGAPRVPLELWGGVECTVNRVGEEFRDQLKLSGHDARNDDIDRFAELGLRTLRFPVLWERTAPDGLERADWRWADARLSRMRELEMRPIVGLLHHGSGPAHTSLLDPAFPDLLASYARAVAERYPWVWAYTPVNEPLTTARFSALYGHWYPHARSDQDFARALLLQCRASILAMRAIREVNPRAALVQTEDLGKTYSTPLLAYQANFDNDRRWITFDLLTGRLGTGDRIWRYFRDLGIPQRELEWFRDNSCPPDILGVNHYVTSNRYLHTDVERYPAETWGGNGRHRYADVEAVRVLEKTDGPRDLLTEAWGRYRLPLAVTEAHLGCTREEQLRWLQEVWKAARESRETGVDVRAVTAWSLLGSFDWNSLLTRPTGYYEPGAFDIRGPAPRLTALGGMVTELAHGRPPSHPVTRGPGWWRGAGRFSYGHRSASGLEAASSGDGSPPILVTGRRGTLATAFGRLARVRGLETRLLGREDLDVAEPASVTAALAKHRPWAVLNAAGYVNVDQAERESDHCFRDNADGPATLARECACLGIALLTLSTDLVFSGRLRRPYVESDPVEPLNVYGASKVEAERRVAELLPSALVIRTSAFFGPWDGYNLLTNALAELRSGKEYVVPAGVVSPTYVPDLAGAALDLLIDGEQGVRHLANVGEVSWLEFVRRGAELAGVDAQRLREASPRSDRAPRPAYSALGSERGLLLPSLEDALRRYVTDTAGQPARAGRADPSPVSTAAGA